MTATDDTIGRVLLRRGFALKWPRSAGTSWHHRAGDRGDHRPVGRAGRIRPGLSYRDRRLHRGIWELSGTGEARQLTALRLIGAAFALLAVYLLIQSTWVLAVGYHPRHSLAGIIWTAITAVAMFALAAGKARTGQALGNPVLCTEGRGTLIDGILATAVLAGLALNAGLGWWWADPAAGYALVFYAAREVRSIFAPGH